MQLPNGNRASYPAIHGKTLADTWYIKYRFYPKIIPPEWVAKKKTHLQVVIKSDLNQIKNLKERRQEANALLAEITRLLKDGANPITSELQAPIQVNYEVDPETGFIDALYFALEKKKPDIERPTYNTLSSMLGFIATAARAMNTYNFPAGKLTPREVSITLDRACVDKNNKTYNRYKKDLSGLFKVLCPLVGIANPVTGLPNKQVKKEVKTILTDEQRRLVDRHLKKKKQNRFRLFLRLFYTSGSRMEEILRLRGKDVNLVDQWFLVDIKKGAYKRDVVKTIGNTAIRYWKLALKNVAPDDYIFSIGLNPGKHRIPAKQITIRWKNHVKAKPLPNGWYGGLNIKVDLNALRHSALTQISNRYSDSVAAGHAEHTSLAMIRSIYNVDHDKLKHEQDKKVAVYF